MSVIRTSAQGQKGNALTERNTGVWDADALIALGRSLRYKKKHRTEIAIMGQPAHLENDLEFIAEAELARLMLRQGRLTDEARDYIARKYPQ
jgi:hypothetical protein